LCGIARKYTASTARDAHKSEKILIYGQPVILDLKNRNPAYQKKCSPQIAREKQPAMNE